MKAVRNGLTGSDHMKPTKRIPRMSESRIEEAKQYPKLKREFFRTHHECFVCGDKVSEALKQLHHFYGRVNELLCWIPGFRLTCPWCHVRIESSRKKAIENGWRADERIFGRPSLVIPQ